MNRTRACLLALAVALEVSSSAAQVRQDGESTEDKETRAEAPDRPKDMPLSALPAPPSLKLPSPRPRALEAITRIVEELNSEDELTRGRASRSLLEAKSDWVSAIARRVDRLRDRSDSKAMKRLLEGTRDEAKRQLRRELGKSVPAPDYLQMMLSEPEPSSETYHHLVELLALSRMLTAIESTPATRELIRIYVRFGEFMRIDTQRQLEALGDRAVPALIETARHPAPNIAKWASKRLSLLKKLTPHQAVRTEDDAALADTLVALGRNGDPQATRLLISFAGTEKTQVRTAARQGIVLIADAGAWQLRDAYLNTTGKRPPRDWTWKRTARELFTEFDRLRLEKVYKIYEAAQKAGKEGKLTEMRDGYDKVLSLVPVFDQAEVLADGYLRFAEEKEEAPLLERRLAARRAERLAADEKQKERARSLRLLLDATQLRQESVVDRSLIERAVKLNSSAQDAAVELTRPPEVVTWGATSRYLIAGVVAALALAGAGWILLAGLRNRG